MKKIFSLLMLVLCGLTLTTCGDNKDEKNYKKVNKYDNVNYSINIGTGKFNVTWQNPENSDDYKTWNVYLTGFYMSPGYITTGKIFYECLKQNNTFDYYLYII